MIQRIQSIFLFLASAASFSLLGLPFARSEKEVLTSEVFADSVFNIQDHIGLLIFFVLAGILALVSIFLFRNRKLQMRLTIFTAMALVVGIAFGVIYYMENSVEDASFVIHDAPGMYMPAVALILVLLAYRYINKDEKLVKSMDRLR